LERKTINKGRIIRVKEKRLKWKDISRVNIGKEIEKEV
jgi:hypothetical protein